MKSARALYERGENLDKEKKNLHTADELKYLQSLPLEIKVARTQKRILDWVKEYGTNGTYISFSGGKDSTVLLHLVRELFPEIEAVFVDTGLEYPEIREFVRTFDHVTIIRPKMSFMQVIRKYGYPLITKEIARKISAYRSGKKWAESYVEGTAKMQNGRKSYYCCEKYKPIAECDFLITNQCCDEMKKKPFSALKSQGKKPITAQLASESNKRKVHWIKSGCNMFTSSVPKSNPLSIWTEQDILRFIYENQIQIAEPYGDIVPEKSQLSFFDDYSQCNLCTTGVGRTGCMFCCFGLHLEKDETRFQKMKRTHLRLYEYCIYGGAYDTDGFWKPDKNGLGMKHVFDELNKIYGENFIRYK